MFKLDEHVEEKCPLKKVPFLFFTEFRMKRRIEKDEKVYSSTAEFKDRIPLLHS